MKTASLHTPRRRRTGTAAAAFSHVTAITGNPDRAEELAIEALQKGAHSRVTTLAHARHLAAEEATAHPPDWGDAVPGADLRELALRLARSRPVTEQSFVDMESRYGFDNRMVADVFGLSPSRATELFQEIAATWAQTLDPAMVAWLGAGSCQELGALLGAGSEAPELIPISDGAAAQELEVVAASSVDDLLHSGQVVYEHSQGCVNCEQRLSTVTAVRSLVALTEPLPVPPAVARAAQAARRTIPSRLPPSLESRLKKRARPLLVGVAAVLIAGSLVVGSGYSVLDRGDSQSDRVNKLVESAPNATLTGTPSILRADVGSVAVANNGPTPVTWQATSDAPWLLVEPSQGFLEPNQTVDVKTRYTVPEGERTDGAALTITSTDGTSQVLRYDSGR